jgi:DNA-directed RNA polymerase subunit alpha
MLDQFIRLRFDSREKWGGDITEITETFRLDCIQMWVIEPIIRILKRALLSSVPGIAISAVKVGPSSTGVLACAQTEEKSVLELLLNLKGVVLKGDLSEFASTQHRLVGKLTSKGPGIVRADALKFPGNITVVNGSHYIATLPNANSRVELEVIIQRGVSYVSVESQDTSVLPPGFVAIDSCFRPVIKAEFFVRSFNSHIQERERDFYDLYISLTTNGSVAPIVALQQASYVVKCMLQELCLLNVPPIPLLRMEKSLQELNKVEQNPEIAYADVAIEELGLSSNAYNALKQVEIDTLEDLFVYPEEGLLTIPGLTDLFIDEILRKLYTRFRLRLSTLKDLNKKV